MSAPKWTPGPWRVELRTGEGGNPLIMAEHRGPGSVFCVASGNAWADDKIADANLIASAPDLYDFVATLENDDGKIPDWLWAKRTSLLAKARGEQP